MSYQLRSLRLLSNRYNPTLWIRRHSNYYFEGRPWSSEGLLTFYFPGLTLTGLQPFRILWTCSSSDSLNAIMTIFMDASLHWLQCAVCTGPKLEVALNLPRY